MRFTPQRNTSRVDELVLNARTAQWLGRRLWRPTVLMIVYRAARPLRRS
jgi:hypothetical protein